MSYNLYSMFFHLNRELKTIGLDQVSTAKELFQVRAFLLFP